MKKALKPILWLLSTLYLSNTFAATITPSIDILVWHPSQETSSFWASIVTDPEANEIIYTPPNNQFNWEPGFRVGLSYSPSKCFWDTRLYWTYFSTTKNNHVSLGDQIIAPEFFSGFLSDDLFFGANVDWQLIMHMIDLKMSHEFNVGRSFTLCPTVGVKAGTIHQKVNAKWDAVIYQSSENVKHHFRGIGPSFGVETLWQFHPQFSLIGNFSTALMWGKWEIADTYQRPSALFGVITPTTITTSMNDPSLGTAMFEYFLGVQWCLEKMNNFTLQLGFETQFWANQLRITTFQILPLHGDLTLQGGTCRFQIDL